MVHQRQARCLVELTVALHYVQHNFDQLVWDVGHQDAPYQNSNVVKRKSKLSTIHKKMDCIHFHGVKSEYDTLSCWSLTSISAGLAWRSVRKKEGKNRKVVSVIGDGDYRRYGLRSHEPRGRHSQ